ncbi:hypothetical protein JSE7799_02648 [Jannaschia seosinensis]|uniref:Sulfotransferase family protein n=1 Tax=Jannaschia seosinensis TaxID=313367 RepID=A0A0M7BB09_9RHOB|nr:hypothetical protein [Jannaschia seosinensis]CUH39920.1 hypothetical protein JSE7799_02648 [Jannaschia seosinensis]
MSGNYDAFVLFAEMRTGSNHLEASLAALDGVESFGEVFNPVFIGAPNRADLFGIDMHAREADPMPLLRAVVGAPGLTGFRFFHDHDPRVLDPVLNNRRIAKVFLTRNPLDSYVSLQIAVETGQWRLTNAKMAKTATARFQPEEFDALVARQAAFRDRTHRRLQETGQGAFWLTYDNIGDLDVLNGLAAFLGIAARLDTVPGKIKKQNPGEIEEKVENVAEMRAHLALLDPFLLSRSVHLEPARGPAAGMLMAAAESPVLAAPLASDTSEALRTWLTALDGAPPTESRTLKELRPWMRRHGGFLSFTLLRHPLARAYTMFTGMLSDKGREANILRRIVTNQHGVDLGGPEKAAFLGFLKFLKANLNGQSALPVAPERATQAALLAGMAQTMLPLRLIREGEAQAELDRLAGRASPRLNLLGRAALNAIADDEIEAACADAYRRDYEALGFRRWTET